MFNVKGVLFLPENTRPHVARMTRVTIRQLGWEVQCHPSYSQNLVSRDYHLFPSIAIYLTGKSFAIEAYSGKIFTLFLRCAAGYHRDNFLNYDGNYFDDKQYVNLAVYLFSNK